MIVFFLYRGERPYTYSRRTREKVHKNPRSGHEWVEHIPLNKWDIISPVVGEIQSVNSEEKAIELTKLYGSIKLYLPLTERELEKMRPELEMV